MLIENIPEEGITVVMKLDFDQGSGCGYLHFVPPSKRHCSYSKEIYPGIVLDFDKAGRPIGLEVYAVYQDRSQKKEQNKEEVVG